MPVLIDGNNLLFAARDAEPERSPGISTLCVLLGEWARKSGQRVHIVFDGPRPAPARVEQLREQGVSFEHSGGGVSADDVIIERINENSAPRLLSVVSSDHEIVAAARRRRAKSVRSNLFWEQVRRDLARPNRPRVRMPEEKLRGLSAEQTEHWLGEFELDD